MFVFYRYSSTLPIDTRVFSCLKLKTGSEPSSCLIYAGFYGPRISCFASEKTISLHCRSRVTHLARHWDPSSDPSAPAFASSIDLHLSLCGNWWWGFCNPLCVCVFHAGIPSSCSHTVLGFFFFPFWLTVNYATAPPPRLHNPTLKSAHSCRASGVTQRCG